MKRKLVKDLNNAIASLQQALNDSIAKEAIASNYEDMIASTPSDISARYWLGLLLEPLNKKELKSIVDGFLIQLLNEEQTTKLIKFLLVRFPNYYQQDPNLVQQPTQNTITVPVESKKIDIKKP